MEKTYFPGTRVMVFDPRLFVDDRTTPSFHTVRPATVVRWYWLGFIQGVRWALGTTTILHEKILNKPAEGR